MAEIRIFKNSEELARSAAELFIELAAAAIEQRGRFAVALAGGSTPRALYERLAERPFAKRVDWTRVHIFWGDERSVPPGHPDSNYWLAHETWLKHLAISPQNIHRICGELKPQEAADRYQSELSNFFSNKQWPDFDLVLLGMGEDGHTASLFPHTAALDEKSRWVTANYVEKLRSWRVTLTPGAINGAKHIAFLVSGRGKKERAHLVIRGKHQPHDLPAQLVRPVSGQLFWLLDAEAAALL